MNIFYAQSKDGFPCSNSLCILVEPYWINQIDIEDITLSPGYAIDYFYKALVEGTAFAFWLLPLKS